jgi:hypothetical protein
VVRLLSLTGRTASGRGGGAVISGRGGCFVVVVIVYESVSK